MTTYRLRLARRIGARRPGPELAKVSARKKLLSRGTGLVALTLPQCVITSKEDVDAKDCTWS